MSVSTRRAFLGTLGAAAVAVPALRSTTLGAGAAPAGAAPAAGQAAASYDLLIKGGRVIDASQKLNGQLDVAIANGKIAAVAANIPANRAREVFDAAGRLVTPGLINTHAHLYRYAYPISVDPEAVGFPAGVTTAIDAGSGGASTFLGFRKYVIEKQPLRIYAMLNISTIGNFGNELYMGLGNINPKAAIRVINEHKDRIVAIKVRILSVEQVIERVTLTPTKVFKFPEKLGTLEPGVTADVTVIDLQEGSFELIDQQNNKRTAKRKIVPVATVHGGTLVKIDPKVHEAVPHAGLRISNSSH